MRKGPFFVLGGVAGVAVMLTLAAADAPSLDAEPTPTSTPQAVESIPPCTDAIAEAGGICQGPLIEEPTLSPTPTPLPSEGLSVPVVPAPVTPATPPAASVTEKAPSKERIPACAHEDGSGQDLCIWRGDQAGNGVGRTYIVYLGETFYLSTPEDAEPGGPVEFFDRGVLQCGVNAAPAEDTDQYGNNWAYCEPALVQP